MSKMFLTILRKYREILREGRKEMSIIQVNALYDEDMVPFLKSIEMLQPIENGEVVCSVCSTPITIKNIMTIYPEDNEIKICCTNGACYNSFINKGA